MTEADGDGSAEMGIMQIPFQLFLFAELGLIVMCYEGMSCWFAWWIMPSKHLGGRPKDKCGPDSNFSAKVDYRVRCCVKQNKQKSKQTATTNTNKTNYSTPPPKITLPLANNRGVNVKSLKRKWRRDIIFYASGEKISLIFSCQGYRL